MYLNQCKCMNNKPNSDLFFLSSFLWWKVDKVECNFKDKEHRISM